MNEQLQFEDPPEDSGAVTEDRYRYQHHCVARHLLLALIRERTLTVVCEYREDFVVIDGDECEAVSVKHRELSQGAWTLATLVSQGGLQKLFETWRDGARKPVCRLMTNAGLATGETGAHWIKEFNAGANPHRKRIVEDLAKRFSVDSTSTGQFLREALRIDAELPGRYTMETLQRVELLGPAFGALGESAEGSTGEYRALLDLIHDRSTDANPIKSDVRLAIVTGGNQQAARLAEAKIKARTLTTADAAEALLTARSDPYPTLPEATELVPATRLRRKLSAGKLSPTELRLAARLRNHWYAAETKQRDTPHIDDEIAGLEAEVQMAAGQAQREAEQIAGRPYGGEMLDRLRQRLTGPDAPKPRREFSSPRLLEGLAYELTDRCEVWWSPEEDVDLSDPGPGPEAATDA